MVMQFLAVGFTAAGMGALIGAAVTLGRAKRWRHDGKVLRRASAQLVIVADGLQQKAHREFEQARKMKEQAKAMLHSGLTGKSLTEDQNLQLLRAIGD